ncbi:hypothetical protein [Nocardia yamanashiensis]|uniref:hypothetical protein n=1 Tax=Nocardia yamanashiensis TaxID=209247 RepID=UPI000AAAC721|nr:hypothetical protein [Nocardia yamanashiensis]
MVTNNRDPFHPVHEALSHFQGNALEHLNLSITDSTNGSNHESTDALEISLIAHRPDGGINLSVRDIHYFAIQRAPRENIKFLDFTATTLDPSMPLPPGLPERWSHTKPAHSLLWLHAEGEATLDLVAAIVVVLRQVS